MSDEQQPPVQPQPQYGAYPPPPPPPGPPAQPQYGEYAPPPAAASAPPQYGSYPPPPAPPQYGAYPPPPAPPQYNAYPPQYAPPGYGPAWTPPPKPGLIPLRPLGFGTLLGAPFRVLRRNPGPTFGSALIIQIVVAFISLLIIGGASFYAFTRINQASSADRAAVTSGSIAIVLLSLLIPLALALISSGLLQGILVIEVSREVLGEKRKLGELWRAAGKRMWPLVLWYLLEGAAIVVVLAIAVGIVVALASIGGTPGVVSAVLVGILFALGLGALAVWLGTKVSLVPCIIVLERLSVPRAIARSWRLTQRSFWRTFGIEALVTLIVYFASQVVTQPISFIFGIVLGLLSPNDSTSSSATTIVGIVVLELVVLVLQLVFGAITSVVQAAAISVLYIDLRMRKEGLDLELIRFVEARQAGHVDPADDPFQVRVVPQGPAEQRPF
ncbi:hypothetical protein [Subtercola endophyticus]|uniref:hypothetical protein n=1 Tax=Subtercola endophyticus TaxID=2895559 RepID=UPI001E3D0C09|nr:hypothetical protein [Subtercola endophyticus]UFS57718.1 hypothetical protein LQ955_11720 [Subtercola endophyticus]